MPWGAKSGQLCPSSCTHQRTESPAAQPEYSTQGAGSTADVACEQPLASSQWSREASPVANGTIGSFSPCANQAATSPVQPALPGLKGPPPETGAMARNTSPRWQPRVLVKN